MATRRINRSQTSTGGRAQRPRPLLHVHLMHLPEMPDVYIEKSPLFRMHTMKTPTLIMFGTRDTNVPTGQGWEHFRAMQQAGLYRGRQGEGAGILSAVADR